MTATRHIEIFSAGCQVCEDTIALVNRMACPSCQVTVLDMNSYRNNCPADTTHGISDHTATNFPDALLQRKFTHMRCPRILFPTRKLCGITRQLLVAT